MMMRFRVQFPGLQTADNATLNRGPVQVLRGFFFI